MKKGAARPLVLAVAVVGMILALSLQMQPGKHHLHLAFFHWDSWADAVKHFFGYTIIGAAYYMGISRQSRPIFADYARVVWPVAAFAAVAEFLQIWVPGRNCNFWELLVNIVGPLAGYCLVTAYAGLMGSQSRK
jgi:VanZ family protein